MFHNRSTLRIGKHAGCVVQEVKHPFAELCGAARTSDRGVLVCSFDNKPVEPSEQRFSP
jgi:hypothetical protein